MPVLTWLFLYHWIFTLFPGFQWSNQYTEWSWMFSLILDYYFNLWSRIIGTKSMNLLMVPHVYFQIIFWKTLSFLPSSNINLLISLTFLHHYYHVVSLVDREEYLSIYLFSSIFLFLFQRNFFSDYWLIYLLVY